MIEKVMVPAILACFPAGLLFGKVFWWLAIALCFVEYVVVIVKSEINPSYLDD